MINGDCECMILYLNSWRDIDIKITKMNPKIDLITESVWTKLQDYYNNNGSKIIINKLFADDPNRFGKFR